MMLLHSMIALHSMRFGQLRCTCCRRARINRPLLAILPSCAEYLTNLRSIHMGFSIVHALPLKLYCILTNLMCFASAARAVCRDYGRSKFGLVSAISRGQNRIAYYMQGKANAAPFYYHISCKTIAWLCTQHLHEHTADKYMSNQCSGRAVCDIGQRIATGMHR